MSDTQTVTVTRRGRPPGSRNRRNSEILELAQRLNADPIDFMLKLLGATTIEVAQTDAAGTVLLDAQGQPLLKPIAISLDMKLDAAKAVAPYLYARLQSTQVTGQVDVPVHIEHQFPVEKILANPAMTDALSDLALMMAEQAVPDESAWAAPVPNSSFPD